MCTQQCSRDMSATVQWYVRHSTGVCPPQLRLSPPPAAVQLGLRQPYCRPVHATGQQCPVQCSVRCSAVHYSAVQCITVHYSAVQCSAVQAGLPCPGRQLAEGLALQSVMYSTVQYFTIQYGTVLCLKVQSYTVIAVSHVQCNQGILAYIHSFFHKVHIYYYYR